MIRTIAALGVLVCGLLGSPAIAVAAPVRGDLGVDKPPPLSCTWTLSPPSRTHLGSAQDAVTATLNPASCSGSVQPAKSTVCMAYGDSPGNCTTNFAWNGAQTFAPALPAGTAFTVTGTGCWNGFDGHNFGCVTYGPIAATV